MKGKNLDTRSCIRDSLLTHIPQAELFKSELLSFLRKIRFNDQQFATGTPLSNIKYNHFGFQNNNLFYFFYDQLDYGLAKYFVRSETMKSNINKFLSRPLMAPLIEKLFYQNADKWIEKLLEIL